MKQKRMNTYIIKVYGWKRGNERVVFEGEVFMPEQIEMIVEILVPAKTPEEALKIAEKYTTNTLKLKDVEIIEKNRIYKIKSQEISHKIIYKNYLPFGIPYQDDLYC